MFIVPRLFPHVSYHMGPGTFDAYNKSYLSRVIKGISREDVVVSSIGVTTVMKLEGSPCGVVLRTADDYVEQLTRRRKGKERIKMYTSGSSCLLDICVVAAVCISLNHERYRHPTAIAYNSPFSLLFSSPSPILLAFRPFRSRRVRPHTGWCSRIKLFNIFHARNIKINRCIARYRNLDPLFLIDWNYQQLRTPAEKKLEINEILVVAYLIRLEFIFMSVSYVRYW